MRLEGHTVLVTGAGAGVGRGIAYALAASGAHVVVASRSESGCAVVGEITRRRQRATWARCDVIAAEQVADAVGIALGTTGRLDAVVHNATSNSSSRPHRLEEAGRSLFDDHYEVSIGGAQHCAAAAFDALRGHGGTFLVMTSPAGDRGQRDSPPLRNDEGRSSRFCQELGPRVGTPRHHRQCRITACLFPCPERCYRS